MPPSIVRYRKHVTAVVSRTLRLPHDATTQSPVGTELATLADGLTYVSLPDGVTLPLDQPNEIATSIQVVTLTPAQVLEMKAASPHVRLINQRVRDRIAAKYDLVDEIQLLRRRTVDPVPFAVYDSVVEACQQWGRDEKAKLGLIG